MVRAWRAAIEFEGRSSVRSWLYRIATNVCLDFARGRQRRARPMELGPSRPRWSRRSRPCCPSGSWVSPIADDRVLPSRPTPPSSPRPEHPAGLRGRSAAPACPPAGGAHPVRGPALAGRRGGGAARHERAGRQQRLATGSGHARIGRHRANRQGVWMRHRRELLAQYVDAFERYDVNRLVALLRDDAVQSMPPYAMWLEGARTSAMDARPGKGCAGPGSSDVGQRVSRLRAVRVDPRRRAHALGPAGPRDREAGSPASTHSWRSSGSSRLSASRPPPCVGRPGRAISTGQVPLLVCMRLAARRTPSWSRASSSTTGGQVHPARSRLVTDTCRRSRRARPGHGTSSTITGWTPRPEGNQRPDATR